MPPVEFEPTISAGERPKTYALDRAATGIGRGHVSPEILYAWDLSNAKTVHLLCIGQIESFALQTC